VARVKQAFQRPRPSLFHEIATLHSYSFPSGHAMASAVIALAASISPSAGSATPR